MTSLFTEEHAALYGWIPDWHDAMLHLHFLIHGRTRNKIERASSDCHCLNLVESIPRGRNVVSLFSLPALPALYPFRAPAIFNSSSSSRLALRSLFIPSFLLDFFHSFFFHLSSLSPFLPPSGSDVLSPCWFSVISLPCRLRVTTPLSCLPLQSPTTFLLVLLVLRKSIDGLSGGPHLRRRRPLVASRMPSTAMLLRLRPPMRRQPWRMRIPS